jgi:hypothetical protein
VVFRARFGLFVAASVLGAALCFRFPDLDIRLLGIGFHRYFLFHSAILPALLLALLHPLRRVRFAVVAACVVSAFALGVGAHLFVDAFQSKSVVFPFARTLVRGTSVDDRLWEGGNAAICGLLVWRSYRGVRTRRTGRS